MNVQRADKIRTNNYRSIFQGTIVLCVLSGLVVSIVLAIVAVTMVSYRNLGMKSIFNLQYRRYQNAKIKYQKAVITARANPE